MSESQISGDGLDLLIPVEQAGRFDIAELKFNFGEGDVDCTQVAIGAPVTDVTAKINTGAAVIFAGKAMKDSAVTVKKSKTGDSTSNVRLENTLIEDVVLKSKKGTAVDLNIAEGKFRRSAFTAGKGKLDDSVSTGSSSKLINSEFNLRKGDNTFNLGGGSQLKKKNTVTFGKGGTDTVNIGDGVQAGKNAKLIVEGMDNKRDTVVFGGESFTREDIESGKADLPGFLELG